MPRMPGSGKRLEDSSSFQPPWRELNPDGSLGKSYGPSVTTYRRQLADYQLWPWRPPTPETELHRERERIEQWLKTGGSHLASPRELEIFDLLYIQGKSTREAAKALNLSRVAVRTYRARLLKKIP